MAWQWGLQTGDRGGSRQRYEVGDSAAVGIGDSQLDLKSILSCLGLFIYFHILGSG